MSGRRAIGQSSPSGKFAKNRGTPSSYKPCFSTLIFLIKSLFRPLPCQGKKIFFLVTHRIYRIPKDPSRARDGEGSYLEEARERQVPRRCSAIPAPRDPNPPCRAILALVFRRSSSTTVDKGCKVSWEKRMAQRREREAVLTHQRGIDEQIRAEKKACAIIPRPRVPPFEALPLAWPASRDFCFALPVAEEIATC